MITTRQDISKEQIVWLLLHGIFLVCFGVILVNGVSGWFSDIPQNPLSIVTVVVVGRIMMVAVGLLFVATAATRLFSPFSGGPMKFKLLPLLFGEAVVVGLLHAMIFDCGEMAFLTLLAAVSLNLYLLGFKRL